MLQTFNTQLAFKTQLTPDVFLFRFSLNSPTELNFLGGQYLILNIPKNGSFVRRLYSVASSTVEKNSFELIVKIIPGGEAAQYLNVLNVGSNAQFEGPAGAFTLKENNKDKIFLVTGTGIAPARSMIYSLLNHDNVGANPEEAHLYDRTNVVTDGDEKTSPLQNHIFLFWGLPTFKDVFFFEELKKIMTGHQNFSFHICLSREQNMGIIPVQDQRYFSLGHVDDGYMECMKDGAIQQSSQSSEYYLCGRPEVVESLRQKLYDQGVNQENVIFEKF